MCVLGNCIGDTGVTAVAEALKVNTSVQRIDLSGERCQWRVFDVVDRLTICVCLSDNDIGAAGGTAVAEALEMNITVQEIDLSCEWC